MTFLILAVPLEALQPLTTTTTLASLLGRAGNQKEAVL